MPPKKSLSKKPTNRKKKTKGGATPMPSLIFNETKLPDRAEDTSNVEMPKPQYHFEYSEREEEARRWMWIGVASFLAMIVTLWGWSVYLRFSFTKWSQGTDYSLASNAKKDWDTLFKEQKAAEDKQTASQSIRAALNKLMTEQATASSTNVSSTVSTSTPTSTLKH